MFGLSELDFSGVEELVSWLDRQDEHPSMA